MSSPFIESLKKNFPAIGLTAIVVALIIYLTPLKHLNLIEPRIEDVEPKAFYDEYVKNPDRYIFLDVRSGEAYDRLHAAGSQNQPLHTLYNERHVLPKKGKEIILICSGGVASGVAYSYLEHFGFFNLRRIAGGIENWSAQGLPTEQKNK